MPYRYLTATLHVNKESKDFVRGAVRDRLEKLRSTLLLTWTELQERLGVSESMLYFMRTGDRHPSPKMLRRIVELETEAGLTQPVPSPMMVRETPGVYSVTRPTNHLNIVDLKHDLEQIEALARALRAKIEEVEHADDG